jgi:DNA-binding NarL/FixJ family response regulator
MPPASPTTPVTVLVVDDHPMILRLLRIVLSGHGGIDVIGEARDGQSAIDVARNLRPDVVVIDLMIPVVDGLQAIAAIRASLPTCGILVFSAGEAHRSEPDALAAGADAYVEKDAGFARLPAAVVALAAR